MESILLFGQERRGGSEMKQRVYIVLGVVICLMGLFVMEEEVQATEARVIYQVTWLSEDSARIHLGWSDSNKTTPLMLTGWRMKEAGYLEISYQVGKKGSDNSVVVVDKGRLPIQIQLKENVKQGQERQGGSVLTDLPDNKERCKAILNLYHRGVIDGFPDGRFGPQKSVTRAQFAKLLYETADLGKVKLDKEGKKSPNRMGGEAFTDTNGHWAVSYIQVLADKQIVKGKGDGRFDPRGQVTIGQVLTILDRTFLLPSQGHDYLKPLKPHWSNEAFEAMVERGIVRPTDDFYKNYQPTKLATRSDCALLLSRVTESLYQIK